LTEIHLILGLEALNKMVYYARLVKA